MRNVAFKRPALQSTTEGPYHAERAVDTGRRDMAGQCSQTTKSSKPWWRVDLGKRVWVEKVLITSNKDDSEENLSNVEIRIGDHRDSSYVAKNLLCRQGLQLPREPWLYSCPEPMLGQFVFIRLVNNRVRLTLCEVEVYVNGDVFNSDWKYLVPHGNSMLRGTFKRFENERVYVVVNNVVRMYPSSEIIIDRPPSKEILDANFEVMMPLDHEYENEKLQDYCRPREDDDNSDYFIKAKIISYDGDKYLVKAVYTPNTGINRAPVEQDFNCNREDLRLNGGSVCKLDTQCPPNSRCNTTFISSAFPPASYYCECDTGYKPSIRRPGNLILPVEKCVKQTLAKPFISHSRRNLAFHMETSASSTNNYGDCKHKRCLKRPGSSGLAVDGISETCFLSLTQYRPWLIVHLNRLHPISLITVVSAARDDGFKMMVFIGIRHQYSSCADVRTDLLIWSVGCKTNSESYMWGDAVKIQTDAEKLSLCEVEVYAEAYDGNIALKHETRDVNRNAMKDSYTTDGFLYGHSCFKDERKSNWNVKFGGIVRVAAVFVLHSMDSYNNNKGITISVQLGSNSQECINVAGYNSAAKYFKCNRLLTGYAVYLQMADGKEALHLCEVEIFQTSTINVAAKRPTKSTLQNDGTSERGCDQKIDQLFETNSNNFPWWSVDLLTKFEIHFIRIITSNPEDIKPGLRVFVDPSSELTWNGRVPGGQNVATLQHPTSDRVQNISFSNPVEGRIVTLSQGGGLGQNKQLIFLEVEVYNGPLTDVNECVIPEICPPNFECKKKTYTYSCECTGGYKYEVSGDGKEKKCIDKNECNMNSSCPLANSYCKNTPGSYKCLCERGYKEDYDSIKQNELLNCKDVDECENADAYNCSELTKCMNQEGGYTCTCATGYESTERGKTEGKDIKCRDKDECADRTYSCHQKAVCSNTKGSYRCTCFQGLKGDGRHCSELDPCVNGECSLNHQICKEINELQLCGCIEGFIHGTRKCEDNNECELIPLTCGFNSVCINNKGSYKCNCNSGYNNTRGDGKNCTDINECEEKYVCGNVANCTNIPGTYDCFCKKGYRYKEETKECRDIDECAELTCGSNTLCYNNDGSYSCNCQDGFRSPNSTLNCTDIDECQEMAFECDSASNCENTQGGYDCKCKQGYYKTTQGACAEKCSVSCVKYAACHHGTCYCIDGYTLGPFNECYEDSFFLLGSGMSLKSPVMLLVAGLLGCLALA